MVLTSISQYGSFLTLSDTGFFELQKHGKGGEGVVVGGGVGGFLAPHTNFYSRAEVMFNSNLVSRFTNRSRVHKIIQNYVCSDVSTKCK